MYIILKDGIPTYHNVITGKALALRKYAEAVKEYPDNKLVLFYLFVV